MVKVVGLLLLVGVGLIGQVRVNVGGPSYTDSNGNSWSADTGCTSTATYARNASLTINGTNDPTLYRTGRTATSTIGCTYTGFSPALYTVTLLFAETDPTVTATGTGPGAKPRIMNIFINGVLYFAQLNVLATSRQFATAYTVTTPYVAVTASEVNIQITQVAFQPMLSGIDIEPGPSGSSSDWLTLLNRPVLDIRNYNWTPQTPGGTLSAGSNTITLSPVPTGVAGSNIGFYVYITGTGTPEACLVTGGTAVSGASTGTLIMTCSGAHSAGWTVQSASSGMGETLAAYPTNSTIVVPTTITTRGPTSMLGSGDSLIILVPITVATPGFTMAGNHNTITGTGTTIITASSVGGDVFKITGCLNCSISNFTLTRTGTANSTGNGINFDSGANTYFDGHDLVIQHQYIGLLAKVAPVVSGWNYLHLGLNVSHGIQFQGDNDEHMTNVWLESNGGDGLRIGDGVATTYCIGGFRAANIVSFNNGGDGLHIEGAGAFPCTYKFFTNAHFDTDAGYELYLKNAGAISISSSQFVNGKGGWIGDGVSGVDLGGSRFNGSSQEGLFITGGAARISGNVTVSDASLGSAGVYSTLRINGAATRINLSGVQIGSPDTVTSAGIQIDSTGGAPSEVHIVGTQLFATGNMTVPVTIASGLTDVFTDYPYWINLTLQNGWTVVPKTKLEQNGSTVRVEGTITAGTTADGTAIFTLPVGYRPTASVSIPVVTLNGGGTPTGTATVTIASTGVATIVGVGAAAFLRLHAITFGLN